MLWICAVAFVIATSVNTCVSAKNLTDIKWMSGVKTADSLKTALDDDNVRAIEIDVIWGLYDSSHTTTTTSTTTTTTKTPTKPTFKPGDWNPDEPKDPDFDSFKVIREDLAKPKDTIYDVVIPQEGIKSDFTLSAFLKQVIEHSKSHEKNTKSIKINFDEFDNVVPKAVEIIQLLHREIKFPIWLNADGVVKGPSGGKPHIDAESFIAVYNVTDKYVLSLGWTTKNKKGAEEGYTKDHIDAMTKIVQDYVGKNTGDGLNFPIRAVYAIKSKDILKQFQKDMSKDYSPVTFSIWSDAADEFDTKELEKFVKDVGIGNVYLTLQDDLRGKMNLGNGASQLIQFGLLNLATLAVVTMFRNGLH